MVNESTERIQSSWFEDVDNFHLRPSVTTAQSLCGHLQAAASHQSASPLRSFSLPTQLRRVVGERVTRVLGSETVHKQGSSAELLWKRVPAAARSHHRESHSAFMENLNTMQSVKQLSGRLQTYSITVVKSTKVIRQLRIS